MKQNVSHGTRFFFATALLPCPYLPGRIERRVVTELVGRDVDRLHDVLSAAGFRRSHGVAYAPACPDCEACIPVRVAAGDFLRSRNQARIIRANKDLRVSIATAEASQEQYELFADYQKSRHAAGDMAKMDFFDYQTLIEDTPIKTFIAEFRSNEDDTLVAACLVDRVEDGYSAVYSFFAPELSKCSLGSFMILWLIEKAKSEGLPHVYLGFWIRDCRKMSYKIGYQPLEGYNRGIWRPLTADNVQEWPPTGMTP